MGWDACTQDPNWLFRQIECHPATAGWAQAAFALLVIVAAFTVPAWTEARAQERRNKAAYASASIALKAWRDSAVFSLFRIDDWDPAYAPVPNLSLPELALDLGPGAIAEMPRSLGWALLQFSDTRNSILSEAQQTSFEEDSIEAQPSYLRRGAELVLLVDELHTSFAKIGGWKAEPMEAEYNARMHEIIAENSRRQALSSLPI